MLEQNTMTFNSESWPASPTDRMNGIYRGQVVPGTIRATSDHRQVLCDVYLYESMPPLFGVPVMSAKGNSKNGTWHDLEDNDLVVIQFLSGNPSDPVIIGTLPIAGNDVQTGNRADLPRYHLHHQGTDVLIDKHGNRTIIVEKDDTLTIKGAGKITVVGGLTITVTGNATITADTVSLSAKGAVNITAPLTEVAGNLKVTGAVTAAIIADQTGPMAALRLSYQDHTHQENGTGGGITGPPIGA